MKKAIILTMLLAVAMAAGALDFTVGVPSGQQLKFSTLAGNTVKVAMQSPKPAGALVIPSNVTYEGVTYNVIEIGSMAFRNCTGLTSVEVPEGVKVINSLAFYGCTALSSISLPSTLTEIGSQAFTHTAPWDSHEGVGADGLFYIGRYLIHFDIDSAGGAVEVREGTLGVANSACFRDTTLTKITLPASLRFIGYQSFEGCRNVDTVRCLGLTPPRLASDGLASIDGLVVAVPCSTAAAYRAASVWGGFNIVEDCGGSGSGDDPGDDPGDEPGGGEVAIDAVEGQEVAVEVVEGGIRVRCAEPRRCEVLDAAGRRVASVTARDGETIALSRRGVYVVCVEGRRPVKVAYFQ